ncbi:MAG: hypothetical protein J7539_18725 [Niabella sp.]|nr:hypothetical protein [Niabella sp.]
MKITIVLLALMLTGITVSAQKPGVGVFTSKQPVDKVYAAALQAVSNIRFSVKNTDKTNGTIQAEQYIVMGEGKVINLFVNVTKEGDSTQVKATFNKPFGVSGNLAKIAKEYGEQIKKTITDLNITIEDQKKK